MSKFRSDLSVRLTDIAEKLVPVKLKPIVASYGATDMLSTAYLPSYRATGMLSILLIGVTFKLSWNLGVLRHIFCDPIVYNLQCNPDVVIPWFIIV